MTDVPGHEMTLTESRWFSLSIFSSELIENNLNRLSPCNDRCPAAKLPGTGISRLDEDGYETVKVRVATYEPGGVDVGEVSVKTPSMYTDPAPAAALANWWGPPRSPSLPEAVAE